MDHLERLRQLIAPIVEEASCEFIDAEIVQDGGVRVLRIYLDKSHGVTVEDCSRVSHAIEDVIEIEGILSGSYRLEVSSPGDRRPLRTKEHFERVLGQVVDVTTTEKLEGRRHYKGVLRQVTDNELMIDIDASRLNVPLSKIAKARLMPAKE